MNFEVCVLGGCGHVGLPLSIAFALKGKRVAIFDTDRLASEKLRSGQMPFMEKDGERGLRQVLAGGNLHVAPTPEVISESEAVVLVMATPIDGHMSPSFQVIDKALKAYRSYFRDGQLIILRSTLYPGTSSRIDRWFLENNLTVDLAVCPERVTQGRGLSEIFELPQIVAAFSKTGLERVRALFSVFNSDLVEMEPLEAELTKLFNNAWRYIKFAVANQFFGIATELGADYDAIFHGITHNYPRGGDIPPPGFAAGPCLFKDTMQLSAFTRNNFLLGHAAMLVNEGMPQAIVNRMRKRYEDLSTYTVGILGMAFKGDVDDARDSLSHKLKSLLELEARNVLCSDPYVREPGLVDARILIEKSDIIVIGAPHSVYRTLDLSDKPLIDMWNIKGRGRRI
ncbi:MAG: nucleotide sugar dehydrogenase [Deltaproteobacteria bacterium]|nr:nucleotide sugar dehydrogenase [Deltaproteobacteria bacterium]